MKQSWACQAMFPPKCRKLLHADRGSAVVQVEANRAKLPVALAQLPGGGLGQGVTAFVEDQVQDFSVQVEIAHKVRWGTAGALWFLVGWKMSHRVPSGGDCPQGALEDGGRAVISGGLGPASRSARLVTPAVQTRLEACLGRTHAA